MNAFSGQRTLTDWRVMPRRRGTRLVGAKGLIFPRVLGEMVRGDIAMATAKAGLH
jgi:hypothetical protein